MSRDITEVADRLSAVLRTLLPHNTNRHSLLGDFGYLRNEAEAAVRLRADLKAAEQENQRLSARNTVESQLLTDFRERLEAAERERDEIRHDWQTDRQGLQGLVDGLRERAEAAEEGKRQALVAHASEKQQKHNAERERDGDRARAKWLQQVVEEGEATEQKLKRDLATARETLEQIELACKRTPGRPVMRYAGLVRRSLGREGT